MKAIVINEFGGPSVMQYTDVETPSPGPGEVLIAIEAAGVNHVDVDVRAGTSGMPVAMPHVPGVDAAGRIAAIGEGVFDFAIGDRVMPHYELACGRCKNCRAGRENICLAFDILGGTRWGTYAEFVVVGAHHLIRIPEGLDASEAVSAFVPFATAWEALVVTGKIRVGDTVLINAVGSGVGSAGLQVARLAGCRTIVTAGQRSKLERAAAMGADVLVDYTQDDVSEAVLAATDGLGVDLAFDMLGGDVLRSTIRSMASGGRIVSVGAHAGERVEIDFIELFRTHVSIHGCGRSTRAVGEQVLELVARGQLEPVIDRTLPLADAAEAHRLMEARALFGRMVLNIR